MKVIEAIDLNKEKQMEMMAKYAQLSFANLKKNIVQDLLNNRNESAVYRRYDKVGIAKMLESPQKNEKQLRELSRYLYIASSHYRRLIDYYANILLYSYSVIPTKIPTKKPKKAKYTECYYTVINECDKYNFRHELSKAIKIALLDGVYYGLCYETEDSFFVKPFDSNYAKISSIEDGCYRFSVDMSYFSGKEYLLPMYGTDFVRAYEAYKGNKENGTQGDKTKRWFEAQNGICIKVDENDPVYSVPMFCGLLLSIFDIEDYQLLQKAKAENDNYKVISLKMETDDEGVPKMDFEVASKYFNQVVSSIGNDGIGVFMTPFDASDISFQTSTASDRNNVTDAINNFYQGAGTSSALFGGGNISASGSMMLSVKPDEAISFSLLLQAERFFNMKLKKMNLEYGFKVKFSLLSIFNQDEFSNRLSKAASLGMPVKMAYASVFGLSPSEIIGMTYIEEDVLELSTKKWLSPLVSSSTQSSVTDEGGRPTAEESGEQLGESGEETRNVGSNDNR